ncbi:MAG: DUF3857 and transglutaminase domain-containing protein [Holophaga sp.]
MKSTRLFPALALLVGLALPAADPAVEAALRRPVDAARYPQAGAVVLLDETVVTLGPQGRSTIEGHQLIRILQDRALRQISDQKIPFRGDSQACDVLVARTHLPSGETREPEASGIMEVSDPEAAAAPFYSTARLKVVSFPGVQIGAVLELKYRIHPLPEAKDQEAPDPFMGELSFGGPEPVLATSLTLQVPTAAGLKYELFNGAPEPEVRRTGAATQFTWTLHDQPQVVAEAGMVPDEEIVPRVVWTVVKDREELGRWLYRKFEGSLSGEDPAVQAQAQALTSSLASPEAKAERLALFVTKDIQNVPLGLGRVGYRPTRPGTILANRYADCRDKYALYQALLEAVGLKARPVFVREVRARASSLACLGEYQDILARVELPSGDRYYNLGRNLGRLGELTAVDAGRPGLLVTPEGGRNLTTPVVDERHQFIRARWNAALDADGDLEGSVILEYAGMFDQQIRSLLFGRNEEERQVLFQTAADHIKKGARLERFLVSDMLDLTAPPVVTLSLRIPQFACRQEDMMILNLPQSLIPLGETPVHPALPAVKYPFLVPATFALDAALSLKLPPGFRVAYAPRTGETLREPLTFKLACDPQPGDLHLDQSIIWKDSVVQPSAYPALWKAFGQTYLPANALILLEKEH